MSRTHVPGLAACSRRREGRQRWQWESGLHSSGLVSRVSRARAASDTRVRMSVTGRRTPAGGGEAGAPEHAAYRPRTRLAASSSYASQNTSSVGGNTPCTRSGGQIAPEPALRPSTRARRAVAVGGTRERRCCAFPGGNRVRATAPGLRADRVACAQLHGASTCALDTSVPTGIEAIQKCRVRRGSGAREAVGSRVVEYALRPRVSHRLAARCLPRTASPDAPLGLRRKRLRMRACPHRL